MWPILVLLYSSKGNLRIVNHFQDLLNRDPRFSPPTSAPSSRRSPPVRSSQQQKVRLFQFRPTNRPSQFPTPSPPTAFPTREPTHEFHYWTFPPTPGPPTVVPSSSPTYATSSPTHKATSAPSASPRNKLEGSLSLNVGARIEALFANGKYYRGTSSFNIIFS